MNYASYLQLNQLLSLQQPHSPPSEHRNENLFIITHQICELWFKQLIDEIHHTICLIEGGNIPGAIETMTRINAITQAIVHQISVICTLKFQEFQRFRSYLGCASGFQSYQFASIEALLNKPNHKKLQQHNDKIHSMIAPVSLWEALRRHLMVVSDGSGHPVQSFSETIKKTLEQSCCESLLLNQLLDLDSLMQEWRYRHIKLVERTIGTRKGTGGSSGAGYLKSTLFTPFFDELWDAINQGAPPCKRATKHELAKSHG